MSFLFQSVLRINDVDGAAANNNFQTKAWSIKGLSTKATVSGGTNQGNTDDNGQLYVTLIGSSTQVQGRIYKAFSGAVANTLVATFTATNKTSAVGTIVASNASGITGEVTVVDFTTAHQLDNPIQLQCFYSLDADVSIYEDPTQFTAWTPQRGLAQLHNEAAFQINEYVSHRFRERLHSLGLDTRSSPLFSTFFTTATEPNLARIHNPQQLRRASAYYAIYLAYSRDFLGGGEDDSHHVRAKYYYNLYKDEISSVNLDLDLNQDDIIDDIVSGGGFSWSRS